MRFIDGHALNVVARQPLRFGKRYEYVAPPQRFFGRLRFWNVNAEGALHPGCPDAEGQQCQIEERSAGRHVRDHTRLREMQAAHAIPNDDVARLMYYLDGVNYCLNRYLDNKYTDFSNYHSRTAEERQTIVACCILLSPDLLRDKVMFVTNDTVALNGGQSRYLEISEATQVLAGSFTAEQSIVIEGKTVNINKIMLCTEAWLRNNYYSRLESQVWRINDPYRNVGQTVYHDPPRNYGGGGRRKTCAEKCCTCGNCIMSMLMIVAGLFLAFGILCITNKATSPISNLCLKSGSTNIGGILMIVIPGIYLFSSLIKCCQLACKN